MKQDLPSSSNNLEGNSSKKNNFSYSHYKFQNTPFRFKKNEQLPYINKNINSNIPPSINDKKKKYSKRNINNIYTSSIQKSENNNDNYQSKYQNPRKKYFKRKNFKKPSELTNESLNKKNELNINIEEENKINNFLKEKKDEEPKQFNEPYKDEVEIDKEFKYDKNDKNDENFYEEEHKKNFRNKIKDCYYNKIEGLYNSGYTCYLNSFLQILFHIPGLINSLKDYKDNIDSDSLLFKLLNVADFPSRDNLYYLRKKFSKINSNFKYYTQEDSQEFGAEFIKALNNELYYNDFLIGKWEIQGFDLIKNNKKKNIKYKLDKLNDLINDEDCEFKYYTIISDLFNFMESDLIVCNNRSIYNFYSEVDNQLSFNLNYNYEKNDNDKLNIIDMLKNKYLYGNNKLIKLPKILMITLLRAIIEKPLIDTKVEINDEINLKDFLDKDFGNYSLCTKYSLYAVNVCIGKYKKYGHYYSYILINNIWYKFDDLTVIDVDRNSINKDLSYIYGIYYINNEYLKSFYNI